MRERGDLHIALNEVKRSDGHVSKTTAEDSTGRTGGVVCRRVQLYLASPWRRFGRRWNEEALVGFG